MSMIQIFLKELENESKITRKMFERVPEDSFGWKPHEKSMTIQRLVTHIADLPNWITMGLTTDELDFNSNNWKEPVINTKEDLMAFFETSVASGRTSLLAAKEGTLDEQWILRAGDEIYMKQTKEEVLRMSLNQTVHHRAQLGVFLRLLNVPIPGSYGPSADELEFA